MRTRNHARHARRRQVLLRIEALEDRRLLSVDVEPLGDLNPHHIVPVPDVNGSEFTTPFETSGPALVVNGTLFFGDTDAASGNDELLATPAGGVTAVIATFDSTVGAMEAVGSTLYLMSGSELWKSDGTTAGTVMLADVNANNPDTYDPYSGNYFGNLTPLNGKLYFTADDGIDGPQLWMSDGTPAGTGMVDNSGAGGADSNPTPFGESGGLLYFTADGETLWRTDGTATGTRQLATPGSFAYTLPEDVTNVNGTLYFTVTSAAGVPQLWKSDGTTAGTADVMDFPDVRTKSGELNVFRNLTNINGTLLFSVSTSPSLDVSVNQLWKSDGTAGGTVMVSDFGDVPYSWDFTPFDGSVYFAPGGALWKSDGTIDGTVPVAPGSLPGPAANLTTFQGDLYFTASGSQLWKTDGTSGGTTEVTDLGAEVTQFVPGDGELFFLSGAAVGGWNPATGNWYSNGFNDPSLSDYLYSNLYTKPVIFGNDLFFEAGPAGDPSSSIPQTPRLWVASEQVLDPLAVAPAAVPFSGFASSTYGSNATDFTELNGKTYFLAGQQFYVPGQVQHLGSSIPKLITQLWATDGTSTGTVMVKDFQPSIYASGPETDVSDLTAANGKLYFSAKGADGSLGLWESDGTTAGTVLVKNIAQGTAYGAYGPKNMTDVNGTLYFAADDGLDGSQLWKSDGTGDGTVMVTDLNENGAPYFGGGLYLTQLTAFDGDLYFSGSDSPHGPQLWKSDGTTGGTVMLTDLNAGGAPYSGGGFYLYQLTAFDGDLYFSGNDGTHGAELWKTNGTTDGTVMVVDINPNGNSYPSALIDFDGDLYFSANDGINGTQLWKTDGTAVGTMMVTDLNTSEGPYGSVGGLAPYQLTALDGDLYFSGNDGSHGSQLWKTDGTAAGTVMLSNANTSGNGLYPAQLTAVGGTLYFTGNDGVHGTELWQSDGTPAGTVLTGDINPGPASSNPANLAGVGGSLFFSADDGQHGFEPWDLASLSPVTSTAVGSSFPVVLAGQSFTLTATVEGASPLLVPTGTVTFTETDPVSGAVTTLGVVDLDVSGTATLSGLSFSTYGTHTVEADYSGSADGRSAPSSATCSVEVDSVSPLTSTSVGSSLPIALAGQSFTLTATVEGASPLVVPTGTVTFTETDPVSGAVTTLGVVDLDVSGTATLSGLSFSTYGTHTVEADYSGSADGRSAPSSATCSVEVDSVSAASLQAVIDEATGTASFALPIATDADLDAALAAINGVTNPHPASPVTFSLALGGATYATGVHVQAQPGIDVELGDGTLAVGTSAIVVDSGIVALKDLTVSTSADASTIVVNGGRVTIRNSTIAQTAASAQPVIRVGGSGSADLGTANDPGDNQLVDVGPGPLIVVTSGASVPALGNAFTVNGTALTSASVVRELIADSGRGGGDGFVAFDVDHTERAVVVTNTSDSGRSLRQAILDANASTLDVPVWIEFDIPGSGVQRIAPTSVLPTITHPVVIDGFTQPGAAPNTSLLGDNQVVMVQIQSAIRSVDGVFPEEPDGLVVAAGGSTIEGLAINGFANGIILKGQGGNTVTGDFLGAAPSGTQAGANNNGIEVEAGSSGNFIGTDGNGVDDAAERNLISGNTDSGAVLIDAGTSHNVIAGNLIGTDATGRVAMANGEGVSVGGGASDNRIGTNGDGAGDAAERNVISGNGVEGVALSNVGTEDNVVAGNLIGTNAAGTAPVPNGTFGVIVQDGASQNRIGTSGDGVDDAAEKNVISGNGQYGVELTGVGTNNNVVAGNLIGTDATGTSALGNRVDGVIIEGAAQSNWIGVNPLGGTDHASERNLISGNSEYGVNVTGAGTNNNVIAGNLIGTDTTGTSALGNGVDGVIIEFAAASNWVGVNPLGDTDYASERNVISGNLNTGVGIFNAGTLGNVVAGNFIGTDVSGELRMANVRIGIAIAHGASNNRIGISGVSPGAPERNVIVGGGNQGVYISDAGTTGNIVSGNFIGTDATGMVSLALNNGVGLFGGASSNWIGVNPLEGPDLIDERNVISGNPGIGVLLDGVGTSGNTVAGNAVGTDALGDGPLANAIDGVDLQNGASGNTVGTAGLGANVIAFNNPTRIAGGGVVVLGAGSTGNALRFNAIHDNGGLGIDLGGDGVTLNTQGTSPSGPNDLQATPLLTAVSSAGSSTTVTGTFQSGPGQSYAIDIYADVAADPSGFGEGQQYLGSIAVTTDGTGSAGFTATFPTGVPTGQFVAATATDSQGNTSEFSLSLGVNAAQVTLSGDPDTVTHDLQTVINALQSTGTGTSLPSIAVSVDPSSLSAVVAAVAGLSVSQPADNPIPILLNMAPGTYGDSEVSVPAGGQLTIDGDGVSLNNVTVSGGAVVIAPGVAPAYWTVNGGNVTVEGSASAGDFIINSGTVTFADGTILTGNSPAIVVNGGVVVLQGATARTNTASPAIVVTGGTLEVRGSTIEGSSAAPGLPAILVTGGTVDLGTSPSDPGNNTIIVGATGELVHNTTSALVAAYGDAFVQGGLDLGSRALSFTGLARNSASGQPLVVTATVRPDDLAGHATGSVLFYDVPASGTSVLLGTAPVSSNGQASLPVSSLTLGSHQLEAVYSGDAHYALSLDELTVTVTQRNATVIVSDAGGTYNGSPFQATAAVAGVDGVPGASLEGVSPTLAYFPGVSPSGAGSPTVPSAPGTYTVVASFAGSPDYAPASAQTTFSIARHATTTTSVSSNPSAAPGQAVTFTATVSGDLPPPFLPSGQVQFQLNGQNLGAPVPIAAGGTAAYTTVAPAAGSYLVTALYSGDGDFTGSGSAAATQVVLAPGVYAVGSSLYVVGAGTSDSMQLSAVGAKSDGTTGLQVKATLNNSASTKSFGQAFSAIFLFGYGGNDSVQIAAAIALPTTLVEGNGNDSIQAGGGNNLITLGDGNDSVSAGNGNNSLTLGNGNDSVSAGNGNNSLTLGNGNDSVSAGNGNNSLTLGNGNDSVSAGNGNNSLTLGNGNDSVSAGNGNDDVTVGNGNDSVQLGNGDNVVVEGNGNDSVHAGNGANLVVGGLGQHTIQLGNGNDILIDGSVALTQPADTFRQVLTDWKASSTAAVSQRLKVTYNTAHPTVLSAGSGRNWFFFTNTRTVSNRKATDRLN